MKKNLIIIAFVLSLMVFIVSVRNVNLKKNYLKDTDIIGVYINNELSEKIPLKDEAKFYKAVCDDENVSVSWDSESWGLLLKNLTKKAKCNLYFYSGQTVFNFDYTGGEQTFVAPVSGTYKLETWGSQGGSGVNKNTQTGGNDYFIREGGYGGYSAGYINLDEKEKIYLNIGGGGTALLDNTESINQVIPGGYNGGGSGLEYVNGGGATHIATTSGTLNLLENNKNDILIVSGGGGGTSAHAEGGGYCLGGDGGGFKANNGVIGASQYNGTAGIGATQTDGYLFGLGISGTDFSSEDGNSGGGGGYYGGLTGDGANSWSACGGGGSGYIGNPLLKDKVMYCYNCEESNEESTKTISTTCSEETPTSNCAKKGNGYAKITLVSID